MTDTRTKPIAITMGDASGVGSEILLRAFIDGDLPPLCVVFGDRLILELGQQRLGLDAPLHSVTQFSEIVPDLLNVVDTKRLQESDWTPGQLSAAAGDAAHEYVVKATSAALHEDVSAVVTLPMNKEATQRSHLEFSGHTELLAKLCEVPQVVMMLATDEVAVSHVSTHVSLRQAIEMLNSERLQSTIQLTNDAIKRFVESPRIGVCGLNPHAGESGMFGDEEQTIIRPVIEEMREQGIHVSGPYPADTVFRQAIQQDQFDALVCMYHDQGHAPMKLFAFDKAVNVTLGLPIVRTSVGHGTAFDIAWQSIASTQSLKAAIQYAQNLI